MSTTVDPAQDLRERWLPADSAVKQARAMLDTCPAADTALIPMCQPGKTRGFWTVGQQVETVHGVILLAYGGYESDQPEGVPTYGWALNTAEAIAADQLGDRPGTTGHAVVTRDGHVAVFEGIRGRG